jgi:hypothetical protein
MTDPTDALGVVPAGTPDVARREATLKATVGVIRRGKPLRRLGAGLLAVGVFTSGGVVGWFAKPTQPSVVVISPEPVTEHPAPAPPSEPAEPLTAERLELNAELADDPADAARLFRQAGDRFLTDRDYENAARCYRRHLAVADADGRKVSASDSWMLLTMKVPVR